ncbi:transporter substrate-binding domain-containing protein [Pseudomonas sp. PCH446]
MGIEAAYPPFNNKDASGQVVGFDKDIGDALCARMKVECTVVTSDWDGIIPALQTKKFDFLISSMSITEERKQAVDFTDPYYSNKLQFIAAKKDAEFKTDKASLKGKIIGAQRATLAGSWLDDHLGDDVTIKLYDTRKTPTSTAGRAPGRHPGGQIRQLRMAEERSRQALRVQGQPVEESDKIGIAVRKKDDALRERLNAALKEIIADGTYKKINDKYFPFSIL